MTNVAHVELSQPMLADFVDLIEGEALRILLGTAAAANRAIRESHLGYRDLVFFDCRDTPENYQWIFDGPVLVFIESKTTIEYLNRLGAVLAQWGATDIIFIHSRTGRARLYQGLRYEQ